jgi:cyclophilin family peptidyl-prolyl cis-trans isomerase
MGNVVVRLDREKAPLTVDNFLTYVEQGFYDQTIFHQVQKGYVILAGGFTADLVEKQTRARVRNEAHNGRKNTKGTIAMARVANYHDSASCQFFFNVADNPPLDYKPPATPGALVPAEQYGYCVFGDVIEGMDVVEKIANVPVEDKTLPGAEKRVFERIPAQKVLILSAHHVQ